jgi:hypothetical protein
LFAQPAPRFEPETAAFGAIRSGASATGACTLDEINGRPAGAVVAVPRGILGMFGWAADPERSTGEAHRFVELASAGRRFVLEAEPMRRADVARALADSRLEDSGFHATGSVRDLPPGDYRIALILQTADRAISCEFPQTLSLAP